MATATTSYTSSTCPRVQLVVSLSSSTGGTATYAWTLKYVTNGYTLSTSQTKTVTAKIGSETVYNSAITVGSKTSYTVKTGTITLSKTTSSQTISISVSIAWGSATWSGTTLGTRSGSSSFTLDAKTSYTVAYNANGGSGAPSSQTKWYDTTLTLSSTKPTRTGYSFQGWGTSASATTVAYSAGASYTSNSAITLYAIWKANTYTVSYDANGGTDAPSSQTKTYGVNLTLTYSTPTLANYNFLGWSTSASSTTVAYASGATYSANEAITLYAVWELAHISPTINNLSAYRCTGADDATILVTGTYAYVSLDYVIYDGYEIATLTVNGTSVSVSGTTGSASIILSVSIESTDITVTVADTVGSSTTMIYTLSASYTFLLAWDPTGTGLGVGMLPADTERVESAYPMYVDGNTYINGDVYVGSKRGHSDYEDGEAGIIISDDGYIYAARDGNAGYYSYDLTTGYQLMFGIGVGHYNRGIWDSVDKRWMIYADENHNTFVTGGPTSDPATILVSAGGYIRVNKPIIIGSGKSSANDGVAGAYVSGGHIELCYSTPFIDFHYNNSTSDFTHRIIANSESGNLVASPGISSSSDRRLKQDITDVPDKYINLFDAITPREYRLIKGGGLRLGVIAQEILEAESELDITESVLVGGTGETNENGEIDYYSVDYDGLLMMAVAKIKQLEERIVQLENSLKGETNED